MKYKKKKRLHVHIKYLFGLVILVLMMSVGYATVNNVTLSITGSASLAENGEVKITYASLEEYLNVVATQPTISANGESISFQINTSVNSQSDINSEHYAKYLVTITNDSLYSHTVSATTFESDIVVGDSNSISVTYNFETLDGTPIINSVIPAKTTLSFYVIVNLYPSSTGDWTIGGNSGIETNESDNGMLIGSIPSNSNGDLSGSNTTAMFTASVINSYQQSKQFTFSINNPNFQLVDANGNSLSTMTISGGSSDNFNFYIKKVVGTSFASSPQNLNVFIECDGNKSSMGIASLIVDVDPTLTDFEAPTISNVNSEIKFEQGSSFENGKLYVSWNGTDNVGIDHYIVETYLSDSTGNTETFVKSESTVADETNIYISGLTNNSYYFFKVYGVDTSGNTASASEISACTTSSGHCSKSENKLFKWTFTVTFNLTNASSSIGNSINVNYDGSVTTTLSGSGNNVTRPSSISSIVMTSADGQSVNLSTNNTDSAGYSYNQDNGQLNIWHIIGDITVTASGQSTCLAKGTKILLANGKTKNIENIKYDDLLAVWSYDDGKITYEYPLWIENEHKTNEIIKITFDDDSYIDIVGNHSFYNTDINLFVNVQDKDNFHIGTNIAKIDENNNIKTVSVKSIEKIKKDTTYYFVGTTTYYNIIANNIITTDSNTLISNLYGFDNNATWPKEKENIVQNSNNILDYSCFKDILPYYIYRGFRAGEVGYLINNNTISLNEFKYYITNYVTNQDYLMPPIRKNKINYWMVTTNEDFVYEYNKNSFLKREGSIYTLPQSKRSDFKGWFNTSNNRVYKPGDKINVVHGLHFIGIYK